MGKDPIWADLMGADNVQIATEGDWVMFRVDMRVRGERSKDKNTGERTGKTVGVGTTHGFKGIPGQTGKSVAIHVASKE